MKVSLFGGSRGMGESILLELNTNEYIIIDSFKTSSKGNPRILDYLINNSINPSKVIGIVLTHCHQDHFTGISQLVKTCSNANFYISKAIGIGSFGTLIAAYSKKVKSKHNYFQELIDAFKAIKKSGRKVKLLSDTSKPIYNNNGIVIQSFSPNSTTEKFLTPIYKKETTKFIKGLGIKLLTHGYNFQSVVFTIECDNYKILLGADQEYHRTNNSIGWNAIETNNHFQNINFDLFKVPHHGSKTGYNSNFWTKICKAECKLILTPFSKSNLPRTPMINSIKTHGDSFITFNGSKKFKSLPGKIGKKTKHLKMRRVSKNQSGEISSTFNLNGNQTITLQPNATKL